MLTLAQVRAGSRASPSKPPRRNFYGLDICRYRRWAGVWWQPQKRQSHPVGPCGMALIFTHKHASVKHITNRFSSISFLRLSFSALYAVGSNLVNREPDEHNTEDSVDTVCTHTYILFMATYYTTGMKGSMVPTAFKHSVCVWNKTFTILHTDWQSAVT